MVKDAEFAVGIFSDGKFDAVDAQNDVLQGLGVEADLGVGHIGVDDDQMIGVDRVEPVFDPELALAANDVEELHMIVGVWHRMPVAAVAGPGGVEESGSAADGVGLICVHCIVTSAHTALSDFRIIDIIYHILAIGNRENGTKTVENRKEVAYYAQRCTNCTKWGCAILMKR